MPWGAYENGFSLSSQHLSFDGKFPVVDFPESRQPVPVASARWAARSSRVLWSLFKKKTRVLPMGFPNDFNLTSICAQKHATPSKLFVLKSSSSELSTEFNRVVGIFYSPFLFR